MELVKLTCSNCGASLEVNKDLDTIYCNYCGTKILMKDAAFELKRVEAAKLDSRKANHEQELKEKQALFEQKIKEKEANEIFKEYHEFKKGSLSKWMIALIIMDVLFVAVGFNDGYPGVGVLFAFSTAFYVLGWLIGMRIIKSKINNLHLLFFLIGTILMVCAFSLR